MRKKSRMLFIQRIRKNSQKLIIYKVDSSVKGLEGEIDEISQRVKKKKKKGNGEKKWENWRIFQ